MEIKTGKKSHGELVLQSDSAFAANTGEVLTKSFGHLGIMVVVPDDRKTITIKHSNPKVLEAIGDLLFSKLKDLS